MIRGSVSALVSDAHHSRGSTARADGIRSRSAQPRGSAIVNSNASIRQKSWRRTVHRSARRARTRWLPSAISLGAATAAALGCARSLPSSGCGTAGACRRRSQSKTATATASKPIVNNSIAANTVSATSPRQRRPISAPSVTPTSTSVVVGRNRICISDLTRYSETRKWLSAEVTPRLPFHSTRRWLSNTCTRQR